MPSSFTSPSWSRFFFCLSLSLFFGCRSAETHTRTHAHTSSYLIRPSFWDRIEKCSTGMLSTQVCAVHAHTLQVIVYDSVFVVVAQLTFHAWVGETKRIHAEEMKSSRSRFSHRWTSDVWSHVSIFMQSQPASAPPEILAKTRCLFFFLSLQIHCVLADTKSFQSFDLSIVRVCLFYLCPKHLVSSVTFGFFCDYLNWRLKYTFFFKPNEKKNITSI